MSFRREERRVYFFPVFLDDVGKFPVGEGSVGLIVDDVTHEPGKSGSLGEGDQVVDAEV